MSEEEQEQIWARLWNQPIYSPPPSPTSVFLISPQLYFSLPPPPSIFISPTPQLHFSPPPTTSVLMSPYFDFSPRLYIIGFLFQEYLIGLNYEINPRKTFKRTCTTAFITFGDHQRSFGCKRHDAAKALGVYRTCRQQWNRRRASRKKIKGLGSLLKLKLVTKSVKTVAEPFGPPFSLPVALDSIKTHHGMKNKNKEALSLFYHVCITVELGKKPDDFEEVIFDEVLEEEMLEKACVPEALPSLLEFALPPKSPKMVSIWSWLSVVKISRKISIRLLQVLPSVQLPQTLHIVVVEDKMTHLLNCSGGFISQDCSLVEERSVEIMVEVDATNNGAHGVKAYENFPIVSHSEKKNTRDKLKRNYKSISVITREDLEQNFGNSREDVANSFGVSVSTMKRIFRKHGISRWPFQPDRKKERSMEVISPSMHEKPDSRVRCIQTPLHARSSPRTIALLDEGEMVQLDSSKQQSLVEFDVTNNSAHLFRASQRCSTVSHSDEPNSRETLKRECTTESVLSFEDLQQHFGCKLEDAAKALGVSVSTVKRTCRQHGIPRWPSRKEKKVSVSTVKRTCRQHGIPRWPSRKEKKVSTTHRIHLEPQGEKDVSPTYRKIPTDGQTERANEMVGHIQYQNEGPNMLNIENGSNKESITTPSFQDYVPVSEMDCILLEPEREKTASPTCKTPTVGFFMGEHVSESSWTMPLRSDLAPMQTMTTIRHIMPHLTEMQDIRTITFKAQYRDKKIKFRLSLPSGIVELKKQVINRLGELGSFEVHYEDNDNEWILIGCDTDVWDCFELSSSSGNEVVRLLVRD